MFYIEATILILGKLKGQDSYKWTIDVTHKYYNS